MGLQAEARIVRPLAIRLGAAIAVGGGTADGAASAARALVAEGTRALISFGLAGGLNPDLPPGFLLVPRHVIVDGRIVTADARLSAALGGPTPHTLLAARTVAATPRVKAALRAETGADAVDLETAAVLAACAGRPFAVIRAVCDPADRRLPPAALLALDGAGQIGFWPVLRSVLSRPGQIGALLLLARDAARARTALIGHVAYLESLRRQQKIEADPGGHGQAN